jgi:hypothetical protein
VKEQAFQETIKSTIVLENGSKLSSDGVGSCSSGEFHEHGD